MDPSPTRTLHEPAHLIQEAQKRHGFWRKQPNPESRLDSKPRWIKEQDYNNNITSILSLCIDKFTVA